MESYQLPDYAKDIKFKAVLMTPQYAERLLLKNHPRNRLTKNAKIEQMTHDILDGNWVLTPEPIVLSTDDELLDGQNRLTAIVKAGITVPVFLCFNVPANVMKALDIGTTRTIGDVVKITGQDIKGINGVAAVARRMAQSTRAGISMSIQETLAWIKVHAKSLEFVWSILPINATQRGLTPAGVRAVVARAYYHSPVAETRKRLEDFGRILISGLPDNRDEDEAVIRLRNWLLEATTGNVRGRAKAKPSTLTVYAKTQSAVSAFLERRSLGHLQETSKELFPLTSDVDE